MKAPQRPRTLALAAMYQCLVLADQLARTGAADPLLWRQTMRGLLVTSNTDDPAAVYGGLRNLKPGLAMLESSLLAARAPANKHLVAYANGLIQIEKLLRADREVATRLAIGLGRIRERQLAESELLSEATLEEVSGLYVETLGTLKLRLQIKGVAEHLSKPTVAHGIRTCLMAAMASLQEWRRLGGKRWQLIFGKGAIVADIHEIISSKNI